MASQLFGCPPLCATPGDWRSARIQLHGHRVPRAADAHQRPGDGTGLFHRNALLRSRGSNPENEIWTIVIHLKATPCIVLAKQ